MLRSTVLDWHALDDVATGVRIYRLSGMLAGTPACFEFLEKVRADLHENGRPVLLELSHLERLTSTGVGIVAAIYTSAANARQRLALAGLTPASRLILRVVRLLDVLPVYDDESSALAALASGGWERRA